MSDAPDSPCISVCIVNPDRVCLGCGRSTDEVGAWSSATVVQQQKIVDAAAKRLEALNAALFNSAD
jgi:predicted Fe-S protein YdhL (DUF1289 family)